MAVLEQPAEAGAADVAGAAGEEDLHESSPLWGSIGSSGDPRISVGGGRQVVHDGIRHRRPGLVVGDPLAGPDEEAPPAAGVAGPARASLIMSPIIQDRRQVEVEVEARPEQHPRPRLAVAVGDAVRSSTSGHLGAVVDAVERHPFGGELALHLGVDRLVLLDRDHPPADRRLVGDHDQAHSPRLAEPTEGPGGVGQEPDPGRVGEVMDVLDDRAVAVEEHGRAISGVHARPRSSVVSAMAGISSERHFPLDDPGRVADGGRAGGDVAEHHAHGPDLRPPADPDAAEDLGVGPELDVVLDDRQRAAVHVVADRHPLAERAVGPDDALGMDEDVAEVPDLEPGADLGRLGDADPRGRLDDPERQPVDPLEDLPPEAGLGGGRSGGRIDRRRWPRSTAP